MHTELKNPEHVAQALMAFALQTTRAAQELIEAGQSSAELSPETARVIQIWQNGERQGAQGDYLHPTAQAIEADSETELFAIITAVRAMRDAIERSALSPALRVWAAVELAYQLMPGDVDADYVELVAADVRAERSAILPYDVVMRTVGKALIMAKTAGRAPLRPEMRDFIEHAERMFNSANFAPRILGVDLGAGDDQTVTTRIEGAGC